MFSDMHEQRLRETAEKVMNYYHNTLNQKLTELKYNSKDLLFRNYYYQKVKSINYEVAAEVERLIMEGKV